MKLSWLARKPAALHVNRQVYSSNPAKHWIFNKYAGIQKTSSPGEKAHLVQEFSKAIPII